MRAKEEKTETETGRETEWRRETWKRSRRATSVSEPERQRRNQRDRHVEGARDAGA